ncbi:MAG: type I 3-dehydroquinate dehydratase [Bacteroidales bacterium]|jgi:3-dehydroquinate synthase
MHKPGQIVLSEDFALLHNLVPEGSRVAVLYDRNVEQWLERMADMRLLPMDEKESLKPRLLSMEEDKFREPWLLLPLDGGEDLKQWVHVEQVLEVFLSRGVDRSWFVVGMGGGTVCDFTGFVASVYMRGLPFGLVPTTLLAQVDAALGGKNGIHWGPYKNVVGSTVLPRWVYCNPQVLETLPPEEFRCGLAECIKHAAIADASYFAFIRDRVVPYLQAVHAPVDPKQAPVRLPLPVLKELIATSQRIKMSFVEADLTEQGVRKALNFGHTFGHALAACRPGIRHGQAVACGMVLAAASASDLRHTHCEQPGAFLSRQEYLDLVELLKACGLEVSLPCPVREIIPFMLADKKKQGDELQLVLLSRLGQYVFVKEPVIKWRNRSMNPGVSLGTAAALQVTEWLDKAPWVEMRLDLIEPLSPIALVALRMQCMGKEHRLMLTLPAAAATTQVPPVLAEMLSWGVGWVDIPLDAPAGYEQEVTNLARQYGTQIIRSAHFWQEPQPNAPAGTSAQGMHDAVDSGITADFGLTAGSGTTTAGSGIRSGGSYGLPSEEVLDALTARAFAEGADFLKIAVQTQNRQESDALLAWCDRQNTADNSYKVTLMIMGDDALRARRHALRNGYPFVYAAAEEGQATAPGQPLYAILDE